MRTDFRGTSIRSSLVTRPHYSNLYNRIERFGEFLRGSDVQADVFQTCARDDNVMCALRSWIAPVDCARGP